MTDESSGDIFGLVGTLLDGQYRVDSVVGEGGFGLVYRGWHLSFDQPIAIKALKVPAFDVATQNSVLAKFREEARLLYVLSQSTLSIVRSIGFGALNTPSGAWAPFVVLEWLEGQSLAADLAARQSAGMRGRSVNETIALMDPAARGLAAAHAKHVAHRDVKPANFFLTMTRDEPPRQTMKVLDFGIAKVMLGGETAGGTSSPTTTGFSSFTPYYAAPEQFDAGLGPTGPWTDVYAFALVLTEVLTDRPAVEGADMVSLIKAATSKELRPTPRARGATVNDAIEAVFARALALDPKTRFADAGQLWTALLLAATHGGTRAIPSRSVPTASRAGGTQPMPSIQTPVASPRVSLPAVAPPVSQPPAYGPPPPPAAAQGWIAPTAPPQQPYLHPHAHPQHQQHPHPQPPYGPPQRGWGAAPNPGESGGVYWPWILLAAVFGGPLLLWLLRLAYLLL